MKAKRKVRSTEITEVVELNLRPLVDLLKNRDNGP